MPGRFSVRAGIAAFAGGVILLYCIGEIPPWQGLLVALSGLAAIAAAYPPGRRALLLAVCVLAGLLWAGLHAQSRLDSRFPATLPTDVPFEVIGFQCSLSGPGSYNSLRFDFCITRWVSPDKRLADVKKIRLSLYGDHPESLPHQMRLTVRLKPPHGTVNPEGFRYETWLFRHGYDATGSIKAWAPEQAECGVHCHYSEYRAGIAGWLQRHYGTMRRYPLIEALVLGERRYLESADWERFRVTGTSHLIAISGLHIGLIGLLGAALARALLRCVPSRFLGSRARRRWVVGTSMLFCLLYALLAGLSVPTQRALVMAIVASVVYLRGRLSGYWTAWLIALAGVLLIDPFAPLDGGFWLSFGAVACLILVFSGRLRRSGAVRSLLIAQCAVGFGLLPVSSALGLTAAPLGWLANILAIPWLSLVVMPVLMMGIPAGAFSEVLREPVMTVIDVVLGAMTGGLEFIASMSPPAATVLFSLSIFLAFVMLLCLFPVPNSLRRRIATAGAISVLTVVGCSAVMKPVNRFVERPELWIWDVGQGLSVMFRDGHDVMLYDTGPGSPSGETSVGSAILPTLRSLGVNRLSLLVISHGDADHASGLDELLGTLPVDQVVSGDSERVRRLAGAKAKHFEPCQNHQPAEVGKGTVGFWQQAPKPVGSMIEGNNASCVVRIRFERAEIIIPGDISIKNEGLWLSDNVISENVSRLLLAPHHGSKTSSGVEWIRQLDPDHVVFSSGFRHPYGHPAGSVVDRYTKSGAQVYSTALSGALRFVYSSEGWIVHSLRNGAPFWIEPGRTPSGNAL
nr:DNA internalization-related competence protein ComEC/Rec2 [Marinobacter sp. BGYM27]